MTTNIITPSQSRIPIGSAYINGVQIEVLINPEWARFFETMTTVVVNSTTQIGSINNIVSASVAAADDSGSAVEFIPLAGPQGPQGAPGPALFMLQDSDTNDIFWPIR